MLRIATLSLLLVAAASGSTPVSTQATAEPPGVEPAPARAEGDGPFERLILRGATLIDGTGAPPFGPVDVVIEGTRITRIQTVGYPGVPIDPDRRPEGSPEAHELDLHGMYLLPGFVDLHAHMGGRAQGTPAEYVFKLWMGHGVTTIRDPGSGNGLQWSLDHKTKSAENRITAPRIHAYLTFGSGRDEPIATPEAARDWVRAIARQGADGIKFFALPPSIIDALLDEAERQGLGTASHHAQLGVARADVLYTARRGLTTMEHWYGLPEALFVDRTVQHFPLDYNYLDEQHRFAEAGRLWRQAAAPGSERWKRVLAELVELDLTMVPTLNIYEASRDLMRAWRAEWHDEYTLPSLWDFFRPSREAHGSYWFYWTTEEEVDWRENYRLWMAFLEDFKNHGGRVATGSDSGFIYQTYGFGYVRELELLREAGFHPLEVVRAATLMGAEALGVDDRVGSVEVGKLADLVVVDENPLANFKVLYGTGAIKVDDDNRPTRVGGVRYTIKDGIVFDAPELLADVRRLVAEAKAEAGIERLPAPGLEEAR